MSSGMEKYILMTSKWRRIYSPPEPRKIMHDIFARKYVNYLVPALTKISEETDYNHEEIEKIVRYEADMALVFSAEGRAWSHALKQRLQRQNASNVDGFPNSSSTHPNHANVIENEVEGREPNAMLSKQFSSNVFPTHKPAPDNEPEMATRREMQAAPGAVKEVAVMESKEEEEKEEEEEIRRRLTYLRTILPGGSEMKLDEFMLSELGSYICCLESQVNILRSMVQKY